TEVRDIHVYPLAGDRKEIPLEALRAAGLDWPADYVVIASVACDSPNPSPHIVVYSAHAISWYALKAGKLSSWSHRHYSTGCRSTADRRLGAGYADARPA